MSLADALNREKGTVGAYVRRVFGGGQSLPCVRATCSELHIYRVTGVKDEGSATSLRALAHEQWDTEMWEGKLDWHWACKSFRGGN